MKKLKRFGKDEQGATMIIVAILLSVLMGFTAIVIDVGISYNNKTNLQSAADAVSLAVSTQGAATEGYNPVKNATQNIALRKSVYDYFKLNNIDSFEFDENDPNSSNIEVWSLARKEYAIETAKENPDRDVALIFYNSTDEYQYIEVYAHTHTNAMFGKIFDFEAYNLTVSSAAKCQILFGGNPEALSYQILELDPTQNFDITGPIENTGLKTFLDWTNNATNGILKFLQEDTILISKIIMGGKTAFNCPYCGAESTRAEAEVTNKLGNVTYVCPSCNKEMSLTDDSNAVVTTWTTSVAVLNGYIHSNGGANISIDSIRMNRALSETITCQNCGQIGDTSSGFTATEINNGAETASYRITCDNCGTEVGVKDSVWTTYWNGSKYSSRPILEICYGANKLNIKAGNKNAAQTNDVYLVGDPQVVTNLEGTSETMTRTLYKRGDEVQHADFLRVNKQLLYGSTDTKKCEFDGEDVTYGIEQLGTTVDNIADPGLTGYIHKSYADLSATAGATNVGVITKQTSGMTHNVSFDDTQPDTSFTVNSNTTQSSTGDVNVNSKELLGKIDLGGGKSLPNVYQTYDSYYGFDFDFDNDVDSLEQVINNQVGVAANAEAKDESVAQIVANKRVNLDEKEEDDDDSVRITIDRVITTITGVSHTESERLRLLLTKFLYYDIDVKSAVEVKKNKISNTFIANENAVKSNTHLVNGVANTVTVRNEAVKNSILSSNSPTITSNGTKYFMEDLIPGKDGQVNTNVSDVISGYYNSFYSTVPTTDSYTYNPVNFNGGTTKESAWDAGDYKIGLRNGEWYGPFVNPSYKKNAVNTYKMGLYVAPNYNCYVNGEVKITAATNQRNADIGDGAKFYVNGSFTNSCGNFTIGSNCIVFINGDLTVNKGYTLTVGSGSVLVINGKIDVSSLRAAKGSTVYCKSVFNGNSAGVTFGNLYCVGDVSSYGMTVYSSADSPSNIFIGGNYTSNVSNASAIESYCKMVVAGNISCGDMTFKENGGLYCAGLITAKTVQNYESTVIVANGTIQTISSCDFNNQGIVYTAGELYVDGDFINGSSAKAYCEGKLTINGTDDAAYIAGHTYVGKNVAGNGCLTLKGIFCVAGSPYGSDDPNLAEYTEGINLKYVDVYDSAQLYVRGIVNCSESGFAFKNSGSDDIKAQVFIDSNGGTRTALQTTSYLKLIPGAKLFVQGNANIKFKNDSDGSILNDNRTYLFVSDNLTTSSKINMSSGSLIHCGTLSTKDISTGIENLTADAANSTGLMVNGYAKVTNGSLRNYSNTYIGGVLTCSNGEILNDDNGNLFVNGAITCTNIRFYDNANMFAYSNITTTRSNGDVISFDANMCNSLLLCNGNVTVGGALGIYNNAKMLVKGYVNANGAINVGATSMLYARGNIEFNADSSTAEGILYTDSILKSNYSSVSTLYYLSKNKVYPRPASLSTTIRNNVKFSKKSTSNTTTNYGSDVTVTGQDYVIGVADKNVSIQSGVTIKVTGGDIYIRGIVTSYGNIICLEENGVGGNIYVDSSTQSYGYAYLVSNGMIYCDNNFEANGTNWISSGNASQNFTDSGGRSLTIGSNNNSAAELYVGGNLSTWVSFDNFGKTYVAGNLDAGTKSNKDCVTYSSGQNSKGNAIDGEDNSVTMVGGTATAHTGNENTTICVRSNSIMYTGGDAIATYNFIIGNAFMSGGTKSQEGNEQFNYLNNNYAGLNTSVDGYVVSDVTAVGALKVVDGTPSSATEINRELLLGNLYDSEGNAVDDTSTVNYVVFKKGIKGKSSSDTYDFGFVYISGVARTCENSSELHDDWFKVYGKSVAYIKNQNGDDYALKTRCLNFFPYSRVYINGNVSTTGTPGSSAHGSAVCFNDWFYAITCINGNLNLKGQGKFRDGTKTFINGNLTTADAFFPKVAAGYLEVGKAYDGADEAYDPNNPTILQCSGNVKTSGYIKIYARATLNATGSISTTLNYITLRHHADIRSNGSITATQFDIGSGSNVYAGDSMIAKTSNIKIRDKAYVSVGGNGNGNLQALSYIEIGKREDEDYKYHSCAYNRKNVSTDYEEIIVDDGTTGGSAEEVLPADDDYNTDKEQITCPECGYKGTMADGYFTMVGDDNGTYKCGSCGYEFGEDSGACDDDPAMGATVYVNGTIKSTISYLRLYANTQAYATKSIRSFKYITLRHHAGLYVVTDSPSSTGIMYSYNSGGQLLDVNGNPLEGFYVETDVNSSEYGNVYFKASYDGAERKIYGFTIKADDSESYDADKSIGYLYNNMLYYYDDEGNKVTCVHKQDIESDGQTITSEDYYYVQKENGSFVLTYQSNGSPVGDDKIGTLVSSDQIPLTVTVGSITSYGDLTLNRYAQMYATGNITSVDKYYGGGKSVAYAEGNFLCTKLLDLSSLLSNDESSVCGFQLEHGAVRAGGNINLYSTSDIGGGVIDAVGNVNFNSIYTYYRFDNITCTNDDCKYNGIVAKFTRIDNTHYQCPKCGTEIAHSADPYTNPKDVDLWICSENGNVDFNCIYSVTGGVTYAPNGTISADGIYFEHYGCFIAGDNNINAFYINLHRLANSDVVDMKWPYAGNTFLCTPESAD